MGMSGLAGGLGGLQMVGGAAMIGAGASIDTTPEKQYYGGSKEAEEEYKKRLLAGQDYGQRITQQGMLGTQGMATQAGSKAWAAEQMMNQRLAQGDAIGMDRRGALAIQAMDPNAIAQAQANAALDSAYRRNLGLAANGGAAGVRNALMANSDAAVNASVAAGQQAAALNMQKQQMLAAEYERQNQIQMAQRQQAYGIAQMGQQNMFQSQNVGLQANTSLADQGQNYLGMYFGGEGSMYGQKLASDTDLEKVRVAGLQAKQQGLMAGGGAMMASGGKTMAGGGSGGGGMLGGGG
jgi:hypothetical protein